MRKKLIVMTENQTVNVLGKLTYLMKKSYTIGSKKRKHILAEGNGSISLPLR